MGTGHTVERAPMEGHTQRTSDRRAIHNFKLCQSFALVVYILATLSTGRLPPNHCQLHVLDLDAHEQKVNLTQDDVVEMVLGLVVLKLNVQALLDANFHLNTVVDLRFLCQRNGIASEAVHERRGGGRGPAGTLSAGTYRLKVLDPEIFLGRQV